MSNPDVAYSLAMEGGLIRVNATLHTTPRAVRLELQVRGKVLAVSLDGTEISFGLEGDKGKIVVFSICSLSVSLTQKASPFQ